MVATGTCAFGAHCSFMHDERCLLRPKHLRKQIEHEMINHLLQYRSSKKRAGLDANIVGTNNGGNGNSSSIGNGNSSSHGHHSPSYSSDEETFVQPYQPEDDLHTIGSGSEEYCPEFRSAASSISFSRDSFFWPQMQYTPNQIASMSKVPYGKSKNTYSYDPLPMNDFGKYLEEMSSWYHYLSTLEITVGTNVIFRDPSYNWNAITHRPRLSCFKDLAFGHSL
jgi:hypothetical protein